MTVAGGLGPLPVESKLLHEFFPAEDVVRRVEGRHPRVQCPRQSQGQEQSPIKVCYARPRV
jgi:hypothetical protein